VARATSINPAETRRLRPACCLLVMSFIPRVYPQSKQQKNEAQKNVEA
jgi:hypothetical protein